MGRGTTQEPETRVDVAGRLAPYDVAIPGALAEVGGDDTALAERAATLLAVMPRNQSRETVERLVFPESPERGRRVVEALIAAGCATVDDDGRLRLVT